MAVLDISEALCTTVIHRELGGATLIDGTAWLSHLTMHRKK
jgi:hypothetical protein